jgi:hypothetical protein
MDRATLIRSYKAGDLGFILHSRHQYQWHTGYAPPQTVACPHLGRVIRARSARATSDAGVHRHRPAHRRRGKDEELKAFRNAGFLGSEYGPFFVPSRPRRCRASRRPRACRPGASPIATSCTRRCSPTPRRRVRQRLPEGIAPPLDGQCPPAALVARRQGVRPGAGAEGVVRQVQHRPVRPRCLLRATSDRSRARATSK